MKVLTEKNISGNNAEMVLASTRIDFDKAVDFDNVTIDYDMILLPLISTPILINDLSAVVDKTGYQNDMPWVNYEKTKFYLNIDPNSREFNCSMTVTAYPRLFNAQEESEYIIIYPEEDEEVRELFKNFCEETRNFYRNPDWESKGYSENFDIMLAEQEQRDIVWNIVNYMAVQI